MPATGKRTMKGTARKLLSATSALACLASASAHAEVKRFDVPAQPLQSAISAFGHQADIQIIAARKDTLGKHSRAVRGNLSVDEALMLLLGGTGLTEKQTGPETYIVIPVPVAPVRVPQAAPATGIVPDAPESVTEVVVTGIRGSLRSGQEAKRSSSYMVETIAAEDIGKYPDSNAAESLQRIPGIAMSRVNGEGQQVTVRGMGPPFNTVLLNGRKLATESAGRAFDFDILPSNLLGGTAVYKSTDVALQEGAIGATINLQTLRPLKIPNRRVVGSVGTLYDQQTERSAPQAFGLVSFRTDDRRLGFLLGVSYQQRFDQNRYAQTAQWTPVENVLTQAMLAPGQTLVDGARYFGPAKLTNDIISEERTRTGINATVQYQPTAKLLLTVDALYDQFTVKSDGIEAAWFNNFSNTLPGSVYLDGHNTIAEYAYAGSPEFVKVTQDRPTTTTAFGANLEWQVSDAFTTTLDLSFSQAESDDGGRDKYFVIHGPVTQITYSNQQGYDTPIAIDGPILSYDPILFPAGSPQLAAAPAVGTIFDRNNPSAYRTWWTSRQGATIKDTVAELRWDNVYRPHGGELESLRFGATYSRQEKENIAVNAGDVGWTNYGLMGIPLPSGLFHADNVSNLFENVDTPFTGRFLNFDGEAMIDYLESTAALALRDQINDLPVGTSAATLMPRGYSAVYQPGQSTRVTENVLSAYADVAWRGTLAGRPYAANLGFRVTATDEASFGYQQVLLDLVTSADPTDDSYLTVRDTDLLPVHQSRSYGYILPSGNFRLNLRNYLVLRAAISETLTRPDLNQLNPVVIFPDTVRRRNLEAAGGNGDLKPYTAWNYDLALEWYRSPSTYFSLALYQKRIDGYIVTAVIPQAFTIVNSGHISADGISGTTAMFNVSKSVNMGSANVSGIELALQTAFTSWPGFLKNTGLTASIVLPRTNRTFDVTSFTNNSAFPGLSNSYYATLYYDDGTLEARVSWSRREKYFARMNTDTEPAYVMGAAYVDARIAWNLNRTVQLYLYGVNLTNQGQREVGRYEDQFLSYQETGRRFELGTRIKF
jgi:iron complex outermembrane receptor protein